MAKQKLHRHGGGAGSAGLGLGVALLEQALDGDEVLAVRARVAAHADELRADLAVERLALLVVDHGERALQHVVRELVLHHNRDRRVAVALRRHDLLDQCAAVLARGGEERLLADVRGKLVARHVEHLPAQLLYDQLAVVRSAVLEHELDHIIAELVLHQVDRVLVQLVQEWTRLIIGQVLEAAL